MGEKLPATAASGNYAGNAVAVQRWNLQKQGWRKNRATQGNKSADVIRETASGGNPSEGVEPTYTPVSGLDGLDVFADTNLRRWEKIFGGVMEKADRVFIFYDVTGGVTKQDRIKFDDDDYVVLSSTFEAQSGRTEVAAMLGRSEV